MIITEPSPKIIGNHLITNIAITSYDDLIQLSKTHSSIAIYRFECELYVAAIVLNWNYNIVSSYIARKLMFITYNLNNLVKQDRPIKKRKTKQKPKQYIKCLLKKNPIHQEHFDSYMNEYMKPNILFIDEKE